MPALPERDTEVVEQVRTPLTVAVTPGMAMPCTTIAVSEALQPFAGLVTVNVYTPVVPITGLCEVEVNPPGPVQPKVAPVVVELPVIAILPEHGKEPPMAEMSGAVVFWKTVTGAVDVQPLTGFVTVNV